MDSSDKEMPLARLKEQINSSRGKTPESESEIENDSDSEFLPETCGVKRCKSEADNECEECNMPLCSEHFMNSKCQKNHKEYVKNRTTKGKNVLAKKHQEHIELQEYEQEYDAAYRRQYSISFPSEMNNEHSQQLDAERIYMDAYVDMYSSVTPDVLERGRKRKRLTPEERRLRDEAVLKDKRQKKLTLKPGCGEKCPMQCRAQFTEDRRLELNAEFWTLPWAHRRAYIRQRTQKIAVKRSRVKSGTSRRSNTYQYNLPNEFGENILVCKKMFCDVLNVSDKSIRNSLDAGSTLEDLRGKHQHPEHAVDHNEIKAHIERYHPCVHHYRRAHAPLRRYLPSDIKIVDMHKEFNENKSSQISYSLFQKIFKEMNISMAKLGNEECEMCQGYFVHAKDNTNCSPSCKICETYKSHKEKADIARAAYQFDAALPYSEAQRIVSIDLQKVIMLPRMEMFKTVLFTRRVCLFNETFANVGQKRGKHGSKRNMAFVWHEGIMGRKDEDIASTFWQFINEHRDSRTLTFWLDNCAGQNKNWTLFTVLLTAVNVNNFEVQKITLKSFESGHTFMSADSAHAEIEEAMKVKKQVFDFRDFVECVETTSCKAFVMKTVNFRQWVSGTSQYKLRQSEDRPMLANISVAEFRRGSSEFFYKNSHQSDDFASFNFLKKDFAMSEKPSQSQPRGIPKEKKTPS